MQVVSEAWIQLLVFWVPVLITALMTSLVIGMGALPRSLAGPLSPGFY